jgi:2-C-methyl-D-erythritol 4-phosphate cytidylyltransferase
VTGPVWTIVVAAGSGRRFGRLKQFEVLGSRRVVDWAIEAAKPASDGIVLVLPPGDATLTERWPVDVVVPGGETRTDSVRVGLGVVPSDAAVVCVHDGARPFAGAALFDAVIAAVGHGADGAVPGVPVTDTIKLLDADGVVESTPERSRLVAVQTPQAFRAAILRAAYASPGAATDDAALVELVGGRVVVVPGHPENRKITLPEDVAWARALVHDRPAERVAP